jgi:hypothetical protein
MASKALTLKGSKPSVFSVQVSGVSIWLGGSILGFVAYMLEAVQKRSMVSDET